MALHKLYGLSQQTMTNGEWAYLGGSVKCALLAASYTPNQDTHKYRTDLTGELPTAGGYTLGGVVLAAKTNLYTASTNSLVLSCSNIVFPAVTLSARYAVIYVDTGTGATSPLLSYIDFGSAQNPASQDMTLFINPAGLLIYQAS